MLFKHGHLENDLREHGRSASAEIVSITTLGTGASMGWMFSDDSDITTNWFLCRLTVRVTPPGRHHHGAASPSAGTPTSAGSDARLGRLQQVSDLHDRGALTDAQFAEATKKILSQG